MILKLEYFFSILPLMFCRGMKLNLGRDSEAGFDQELELEV